MCSRHGDAVQEKILQLNIEVENLGQNFYCVCFNFLTIFIIFEFKHEIFSVGSARRVASFGGKILKLSPILSEKIRFQLWAFNYRHKKFKIAIQKICDSLTSLPPHFAHCIQLISMLLNLSFSRYNRSLSSCVSAASVRWS